MGQSPLLISHLHTDVAGLHTDVAGLASPSGTAEGARSFSPWGEVLESGMESILGFQGDLTDPASGLVDMGTRLYAPSLGRFTTRDVVFGDSTAPISLNQYVYGVASPLTHTDPTGMCPPQWCVDEGYHGPGHNKKHMDGMGDQKTSDPWSGSNYVGFEPPRPLSGPSLAATAPVVLLSPAALDPKAQGPLPVIDYLTGRVKPPWSFPYRPERYPTVAGKRAHDPYGDCSAGPFMDRHYGACKTHDYGYDLIRAGVLPRDAKGEIDRVLREDFMQECAVIHGGIQCSVHSRLAWLTVSQFGNPLPGQSIDLAPLEG